MFSHLNSKICRLLVNDLEEYFLDEWSEVYSSDDLNGSLKR